jgi:hypothetical protein
VGLFDVKSVHYSPLSAAISIGGYFFNSSPVDRMGGPRVSFADPGSSHKLGRTEKHFNQRGPAESGTVHAIDKDVSSIIIRKGMIQRRVIYNAATKFMIQNNRAASIDDVIVGWHVTCLGEFNDKTQLLATHVDIRTK